MNRLMRVVNRWIDRRTEAVLAKLQQRADRRWAQSPLCQAPLAPPAEYERRWIEARQRAYPVVDRYELESGAAIEPEWLHRLARLTQVTIKSSDICYQHGRLLYATVVQYVRDHPHESLTIVDTGTARGFSALCMAKALSDAGACGKIVSFDVLPHDARILWNCVLDADGPRTRQELLQDYADLVERYLIFQRGDTRREMARTSFPRVHVAFLDSVHTDEHVMAEFSSFRGRQKPGDVLFFDDYTPDAYPGVVAAADRICREFGYDGVIVEAGSQRRYLIARKA